MSATAMLGYGAAIKGFFFDAPKRVTWPVTIPTYHLSTSFFYKLMVAHTTTNDVVFARYLSYSICIV